MYCVYQSPGARGLRSWTKLLIPIYNIHSPDSNLKVEIDETLSHYILYCIYGPHLLVQQVVIQGEAYVAPNCCTEERYYWTL